MRDQKTYTILNAGKVRSIVDSTDATPINLQVTGHGFSTGDKVTVNGHTVNTNANGTWIITRVNANNFTLDGSTATGGGAGGADGCAANAVSVIDVSDFRHLVMSYATDGGSDAAMTVKLVGSLSATAPDFAKAQSTTNMFTFIDAIDLQDNASIDGSTGIAVATADDYRLVEANVNALKWFSVLPTAGTEGELTLKLRAFYK